MGSNSKLIAAIAIFISQKGYSPEDSALISLLGFLKAIGIEDPRVRDLNATTVLAFVNTLAALLIEPIFVRQAIKELGELVVYLYLQGALEEDFSKYAICPKELPLEKYRRSA